MDRRVPFERLRDLLPARIVHRAGRLEKPEIFPDLRGEREPAHPRDILISQATRIQENLPLFISQLHLYAQLALPHLLQGSYFVSRVLVADA